MHDYFIEASHTAFVVAARMPAGASMGLHPRRRQRAGALVEGAVAGSPPYG